MKYDSHPHGSLQEGGKTSEQNDDNRNEYANPVAKTNGRN